MHNGIVAGYCGGFVPMKAGDGSSSGMLQHAFTEAISGVAIQPWLLFHPEVKQQYPLIWRNVKGKLTGKVKPASTNNSKPFTPHAGLVVIGVHPAHRGSGIAQQLMTEFERRVQDLHQHEMFLSVKKDNGRAIKAYKNFGWQVVEDHANTYVMKKDI